jgi:Domain of unknown function (DUF1840)
MLVTFKTDAGNITMFEKDALNILKMMGHSATVPGAILAEDVPDALERLKNALDAEKLSASTDDEDIETDEEEPSVSMAHRGLPLANLLTLAVKENSDLMWSID